MSPRDLRPDAAGRFGPYGGRYVPEVIMPALEELERAWDEAKADEAFIAELDRYRRDYAGRPTPMYRADRFGERIGATVYVKREDLAHTGSHKINNVLGQALLAKRLGKTRLIAETGAGQHGVATATAAALFGLECVVYMGATDVERQELNVFRMQMLGTEVVSVDAGSRTLKDAISEALRDWVANVETTHYVIGSVVGPHPYPALVADLQRVIGEEARAQLEVLPDVVVACVGGGSNAIGIFSGYVGEPGVDLVGVEAGGTGPDAHGAAVGAGTDGVLHGAFSRVLQEPDGLITPAHSVSAGLDYPGSGPQHAFLASEGLARYESVSDDEALAAFHTFSELEGIVPALESSHAIAWLLREDVRGRTVLLLLSGRGDKDVDAVRKLS